MYYSDYDPFLSSWGRCVFVLKANILLRDTWAKINYRTFNVGLRYVIVCLQNSVRKFNTEPIAYFQ